MEIKNMRGVQNCGSLKATFTIVMDGVELNDCKLIDGRNGLFFTPPSRSYEKGGETKYANYFYITDERLKKEIEEAAKSLFEARSGGQEPRTARGEGGRQDEAPQFDPDSDLPF